MEGDKQVSVIDIRWRVNCLDCRSSYDQGSHGAARGDDGSMGTVKLYFSGVCGYCGSRNISFVEIKEELK